MDYSLLFNPAMMLIGLAVFVVGSQFALDYYEDKQFQKRMKFIVNTPIPESAKNLLRQKHPNWPEHVLEGAWYGVKEFFRMHLLLPDKALGMPSSMVDEAWHSLMLCTREYEAFCEQALGKFLHHTPKISTNHSLSKDTIFDQSLVNTWYAGKLLYNVPIPSAELNKKEGINHETGVEKDDEYRDALASALTPLVFTTDNEYSYWSQEHGLHFSSDNFAMLDYQLDLALNQEKTKKAKSNPDVAGACSASNAGSSCGASSC